MVLTKCVRRGKLCDHWLVQVCAHAVFYNFNANTRLPSAEEFFCSFLLLFIFFLLYPPKLNHTKKENKTSLSESMVLPSRRAGAWKFSSRFSTV